LASKAQNIRRIILAGALYDLAVALPLAIPPLTAFGINILFTINNLLGFNDPPPLFDTVHLIFASLFGAWVTAWAVARFRSPNLHYVRGDLIMRLVVLAVLLWFALTAKTYGIIYLFIAGDVFWTALNWWGSRMLSEAGREGRP
jgi:hypothetical protein